MWNDASRHLFSFLCVYIPFFSLESFCLSSLYNHNLIVYKLKMVAIFLDRCTNKRGLENENNVMSFLKHWNMKRLKWLSLYFHINYHCFYFKVSASVNIVNTKIFTEGDDAVLFCNVSGVPLPVASWFNDKNENVYNGSPWKLPSVNRSYNGTYKCEASNGCGKDSKTFDIIVQCKSVGKPDFGVQPIVYLFQGLTYL